MRIVLVHGFRVFDSGAGTVDKLAPYLRGAGHEVETDEADYGPFGLWAVRFRKHSAVLRIAGALESADVVISHSNGANYTNKALKLLRHKGRNVREIRLSPALNRKTGTYADKCWVFHTCSDWAVRLSSYIPFHPWGRQGAWGFKCDQKRHDHAQNRYDCSKVENIDHSDIIKGHSDWFKGLNTRWIAKEILELIE